MRIKMSKIQKFSKFVKSNALAVSGVVSAFAFGVANFAGATAPTADPAIATQADAVGGQLQANIVSALTTILPYVLAVVGIFLAVKLGMRWMKKSAH
jgi:hypothetical protein